MDTVVLPRARREVVERTGHHREDATLADSEAELT
jgi:hypothetical protein